MGRPATGRPVRERKSCCAPSRSPADQTAGTGGHRHAAHPRNIRARSHPPPPHTVRGLGRLALAEHFAAVRDRLHGRALARCARSPDPLADAGRVTGYGVRQQLPAGPPSSAPCPRRDPVRISSTCPSWSAACCGNLGWRQACVVGLRACPPPGRRAGGGQRPADARRPRLPTTGGTRSTRPAWTDPAIRRPTPAGRSGGVGPARPGGGRRPGRPPGLRRGPGPGRPGAPSQPGAVPEIPVLTRRAAAGVVAARPGCSRGSPRQLARDTLPGELGRRRPPTMDAVAKAVGPGVDGAAGWVWKSVGPERVRGLAKAGRADGRSPPGNRPGPARDTPQGAARQTSPPRWHPGPAGRTLGSPDGDGSDGNGRVAAAPGDAGEAGWQRPPTPELLSLVLCAVRKAGPPRGRRPGGGGPPAGRSACRRLWPR